MTGKLTKTHKSSQPPKAKNKTGLLDVLRKIFVESAMKHPTIPAIRFERRLFRLLDAMHGFTELNIDRMISTKRCLIILKCCYSLESLSVILRPDEPGNLEDSALETQPRVYANKLNTLHISTIFQLPEEFLKAIYCPRLLSLTMERDASTIDLNSEKSEDYGFRDLVERSHCHLESLVLSNVFPKADELKGFLELEYTDQLQQLWVYDNWNILNGAKRPSSITNSVLDALTVVKSGSGFRGETVDQYQCPRLNNLGFSPCCSKDGELSSFVALRSQAPSSFILTYSWDPAVTHRVDRKQFKALTRERRWLVLNKTEGRWW
ncbi:hypothetical protein C0989_001311 [Termitomyces sp. Mn162]|nr:hypothetical protein C0989_001311 [Termitomyces sp. Mn162]